MNSLAAGGAGFSDSKRHYPILDGLRGVAAIVVVLFHVLEIYSGGNHLTQIINHGYLAVDFFFALSGFVIGYAYDDRWQKMTLKDFFKRRLIRLHPMIIAGMVVGAVAFYFSASPVLFPKVSEVPLWELFVVTVAGFALLPVPLSMDIRGWTEMYPTNGPAWSLFFEYIANILYALFIRKFSNAALAALVFASGCLLMHLAVTQGDVVGGWSLTPAQLHVGFARLLFPFFAGLLLSRVCKPGRVNNAFFWCSVLIIAVLTCPRLGGEDMHWLNGLYESFSIILIFPLIVWMGASGEIKGKTARHLCEFLGNISYPLYIIHYPLIYIFSAWVVDNKVPLNVGFGVGMMVTIASVALAYGLLKLYDIPVRRWLTRRWLDRIDERKTP